VEIAVAVIAAGAALLGTFVGGILTARSNRRIERERRKRDDEKDVTLAKATARTLRMRYLTAKRILKTTKETKKWWSETMTTVREPSRYSRHISAMTGGVGDDRIRRVSPRALGDDTRWRTRRRRTSLRLG
jgi:hypothetical protein